MRNFSVINAVLTIALTLSFFTSYQTVSAQATAQSQQIQALSNTLTKLDKEIKNSTSLTTNQRLSFYSQLVIISNAIVNLQTNQNTQASDKVEINNQVNGFTNAILTYNYSKPTEVKADIYFASSSPVKITYTYPKIDDYQSFGQKMSAVRQYATYDIGLKLGLTQTEVRRNTHITGPNPLRTKNFPVNSNEAYELAESFGKHSIITDVDIFPGDKIGTFILRSDQDETLEIQIKSHPISIDKSSTKYSYYQVFSVSGNKGARPVVETLIEDIERKDLLQLLDELFDKKYFANKIEDFDNKLIEFMLENKTHLLVNRNTKPTPEERDCYTQTDRSVMSDIVVSLLKKSEVQHKSVSEVFTLQAPVQNINGGASFLCKNKKQVF